MSRWCYGVALRLQGRYVTLERYKSSTIFSASSSSSPSHHSHLTLDQQGHCITIRLKPATSFHTPCVSSCLPWPRPSSHCLPRTSLLTQFPSRIFLPLEPTSNLAGVQPLASSSIITTTMSALNTNSNSNQECTNGTAISGAPLKVLILSAALFKAPAGCATVSYATDPTALEPAHRSMSIKVCSLTIKVVPTVLMNWLSSLCTASTNKIPRHTHTDHR
jgi:hypothetical protein